MNKSITFEELNINPKIIDALDKYKITNYVQILTTSATELAKITKLSTNELRVLRRAIINKISLPTPISTLLLLKEEKEFLFTGCQELDKLLKGGLVPSWITEISGESASGKTQFCMQLCLTVQLLNKSYGALYISTEDAFPSKRLNEMCERLTGRCPHLRDHRFLDQIFIEHYATLEDLDTSLATRVSYVLENKNVKLVVIDSIAAIARSRPTGTIDNFKVSVNRICSKLSKLATLYKIYVVLINQITDNFDEEKNILTNFKLNSKIPALGPSWSHWMSMRLQLFRTDNYIKIPQIANSHTRPDFSNDILKSKDKDRTNSVDNSERFYSANIRKLLVLSAPHLPQTFAHFYIDIDGIKYFDM